MGADRRAVAEHGTVDDRLAVDRMGDRLAHLDVVERRLLVVHGENGLTLGRAGDHLETRIGLELDQVLGRGEGRIGVKIARHHRGKGRGRVGDELEGHLVELDRGAPVAVVTAEFDPVALDPFGQR
jgi:hypothetical protein